MHKLTL